MCILTRFWYRMLYRSRNGNDPMRQCQGDCQEAVKGRYGNMQWDSETDGRIFGGSHFYSAITCVRITNMIDV